MRDNPWFWIFLFAAGTVALTLSISLVISLCVAVASRRYGDKLYDRHQKKILGLLPGKNCGACGCENCDGYARAVLFGAASESACPYGGEELPAQMIAIVNDMQKLMEDPKPLTGRKNRLRSIWEKKI